MESQAPEKSSGQGFGPIEIIILVGVVGLGLGSVWWAFWGPWSEPVAQEHLHSCIRVCDQEVACETDRGQKGHDNCVESCLLHTSEFFRGCVDEVVALNHCLAGLSCDELLDEGSCEEEVEAMRRCRDGGDA